MEDPYKVLRKKKKVNSKKKGSNFELDICAKLNERFNTQEFCRTPGSGAFGTTHKLPDDMRVFGDLITPKNFKFVIECKKGYNKEGILDLLNPGGWLRGVIETSKRDSYRAGRPAIIIWKQDRKDILAILDYSLYKEYKTYIDTSINIEYLKLNKDIILIKFNDLIQFSDSFWLDFNYQG